MTALSAVNLTATQLGDLPGHKVTEMQNERLLPPQSTVAKKGLVLRMRAAPSEHFLSARGIQNEADSVTASHNSNADALEKLNLLSLGHYDTKTKPSTENIAALRSCLPLGGRKEERINSISLNSSRTVRRNSVKTESSNSQTTSEVESEDEELQTQISSRARMHVFNEAEERRLLNNLIEFDEEEDEKRYRSKSDEEIYQMWRNESGSKLNYTGNSQYHRNKPNKTAASSPTTSKQSNPAKSERRRKNNSISGWETIDSKFHPIKTKVEQRQKSHATISNPQKLQQSYKAGSDSNTVESPYLFFHYTDIARYIQQYRSKHICEDMSKKHHPSCCHHATGMQWRPFVPRDAHYQVKFDLSANESYRTTTSPLRATAGGKIIGEGSERPSSDKDQFENFSSNGQVKLRSTLPGFMFPVAVRPPHLPRSPSIESSANNYEKTVRLTNLSKTNQTFPTKTPDHHNEKLAEQLELLFESKSAITAKQHVGEIPFQLRKRTSNGKRSHGSHLPDALVASWEEARKDEDITDNKLKTEETTEVSDVRKTEESNIQVDKAARSAWDNIPYQTGDKCFAIPKQHKLKLDKNEQKKLRVAQNKQIITGRHNHYILQEDYFPDNVDVIHSDGKYHYSNEQVRYTLLDEKPHASVKRNRMKALIAAEICSLEQRKIITHEQRLKLNNFRLALSNPSYHPGKPALLGSTSNNATRRVIAGSVRAFYSRTSQDLMDQTMLECTKCLKEEKSKEEAEDNKPIIVVSQPHLKSISETANRKVASPLTHKRIIGGKNAEKSRRHPADAKQFTRITDLLGVKERQGNRPTLSATGSRVVSASSRKHRHNSATSSRRKLDELAKENVKK